MENKKITYLEASRSNNVMYDGLDIIWKMLHNKIPNIYYNNRMYKYFSKKDFDLIKNKYFKNNVIRQYISEVNLTDNSYLMTSIVELNLSKNNNILVELKYFVQKEYINLVSYLIYCDISNELTLTKICNKINDDIFKYGLSTIDDANVNLLIDSGRELILQPFKINVPELDINLNYKNFEDKHNFILKSLSESKKGIILLHGKPGTGKSMYIKYLAYLLNTKKTIIYLPAQMISSLTNPSIIPIFAQNPNSILIIEDADKALKSRDNGGNFVETLLNISDGILSDIMGMQIVCTFNTNIDSIDKALLRKGRLITKHEFDTLSIENSQKLSDKLGYKTIIDKSMSLADIYNQDVENFNKEDEVLLNKRKSVGFDYKPKNEIINETVTRKVRVKKTN